MKIEKFCLNKNNINNSFFTLSLISFNFVKMRFRYQDDYDEEDIDGEAELDSIMEIVKVSCKVQFLLFFILITNQVSCVNYRIAGRKGSQFLMIFMNLR